MVTTETVVSSIGVVAGLLLCGFGYVSYARRDEPGSTMFGVFVASWGLLAPLGVVLSLAGLGNLTGLYWPITMIPWCLFTLRYTGRGFGRRTIGALVVPLLGLVPWVVFGFVEVSPVLEALGIIVFTYYTALGSLGALLVLWTTNRYGHLSPTAGFLLALAGFIPAATANAFGILSEQFGGVVVLSIFTGGLVLSSLAVSLVLFWRDVFDSTPAAGTIGERAIARETDDLILIADDDGDVIMRNETADRRLSLASQEALGQPLEQSLGVAIDVLRARETVEIQTESGIRQFDPQVTSLTDQHDRRIGTMVSLRDVTDREIRRQRLEVLNRIVRHNLRNQASVIKANTEVVADELADEELVAYLDAATDSVDSLTSLREKAKRIEELRKRGQAEKTSVDLASLLDEIAAESTERWPAATVTVEGPPTATVESDREILRFVLSNLVENAVEHTTDPTVELRAVVDEAGERYPVTIDVADDGPGIPSSEVEVIEAGTETPMKHGSGVGLWVTNWAVRELGGTLAFPERGPQGSTVRVRLPHEPQSVESTGTGQSAGS